MSYPQDYLDTFGGIDGCRWLDLDYQILYAKYIYYQGVSLGFKPITDEEHDKMEIEYKELSNKLNKEPTASNLVGWKSNPTIEALAMRQYDKDLYDRLKHVMFRFKDE